MDIRVEDRIQPVRELCERHRVLRLALFGSAAHGAFDPASSDLDFVVEFDSALSPSEHADAYFGLIDDLQALFGVPIDLVEEQTIRNPYLREAIEETQQVLYAA